MVDVMNKEQGVEYIQNALTSGELNMKEACKTTGWSFPRVRSRALTIAKKLNSTLTKRTRGVYYLKPNEVLNNTPPTESTNTTETTENIASDAAIDVPQENEHALDPNKVEAALMGDATNSDTD